MASPLPFDALSSLATPQARRGPSSRLLQRRSLLLRQDQEAALNPVGGDVASPGGRGGVGGELRGRDASLLGVASPAAAPLNLTELEVTRPVYSYQPLEDVSGGLNPASFGLTTTNNLFVDFVSSSINGTKEASNTIDDILDQVAEYEELVQEHVDRMRLASKRAGKAPPEEERLLMQMKERLTKERNTWRLLGKLLAVKSVMDGGGGAVADDGDARMDEDCGGGTARNGAPPPPQERTLISDLMAKHQTLRRAQTVVDWLEMNARDDLPEVMNAYGDSILGWENTHHTLMLSSAAGENTELVSELDPDAKVRLRKQLHDCDEKDEQRLIKLVYMCQRAGMLDQAKTLCVEMGQPWRAATLVGWELAHDPNRGSGGSGAGQEEKLPAAGNQRRDLWKKSAWLTSCNPRLSAAERAVYGSLCGNARQLLSGGLCSSWEDALWARAKAMVDTLVEEELRRGMLARAYLPMPAEYWDNLTDMAEIFAAIRASGVGGGGADSCPYQKMQTFIILEQWQELLGYLSELCDGDEIWTDPQLLRFVSHLVLILRQAGETADEGNVKDKVLLKFVNFLYKERRVAQVAWYASQLHADIQAETYSDFLCGVLQRDDRELCLTLGYEHGLPMEAARVRIVEKLLDRPPPSPSTAGEAAARADDEMRVCAVDWLLVEPPMRAEALRQGCAITRFFVADHKPQLASKVLEKISIVANDPDASSLDDGRAWLKEFECLCAYVTAKERFAEWFSFYHKARPAEPARDDGHDDQDGGGRRRYVDRVASERREARYREDLERWTNSLQVQSAAVLSCLREVVAFPGGWLDDVALGDGEGDSVRQKEIEYLRRTCVVESVLLMHTVLHKTRQYKQATELSDLVASERLGIYALFSKDDMRKLLDAIRESFLCLMEENNGDPWAAK